MKTLTITAKRFCTVLMLAMPLLTLSTAQAQERSAKPKIVYQERDLVSDGNVTAEHTDTNLKNAWGLAFNPYGYVWVANNGSSTSTLYDGDGIMQSLVVAIPSPSNADGGGKPTGMVYNGSGDFQVTNGTTTAPSRFIFATEDGIIAGWASTVYANKAVSAVDNSASGAIYKGLAISAGGNGSLLYAADFHNNKIDVFNSTFGTVSLAPGAFTDPLLPAGFAPFGIQAINGDIYVAYAKQDADKIDNANGKGLGQVDVFDPNGNLIRRFQSTKKLNAPWGMALAPAGFGKLAGRLLVGNFGDGLINAFDVSSGKYIDQLKGGDGKPIQIYGLWGIAFGNGYKTQPVDTLFFAAGPGNEAYGLYGRIDSTVAPKSKGPSNNKSPKNGGPAK